MMVEISNLLQDLANWKTVFTLAGAATLSSAGLIPRVGFGRAIVLFGQSLFPRFKLEVKSVRIKEIGELKKQLTAIRSGRYLVITGGKGYGKSCLIETALHNRPSVINISVRFLLFIYENYI
jgi:hypothetical protein